MLIAPVAHPDHPHPIKRHTWPSAGCTPESAGTGNTQLWIAQCTGSPPPVLWAALEPGEQAQARGFYFERDQNRHVAAHAMLRFALAAAVGCQMQDLRFVRDQNGRPLLRDYAGVQFNLSHSGGLAACIVTKNTPCGIDIEHIRPDKQITDIARRHFSPAEQRYLAQINSDETRQQAFYRLWTLKEAFLKALGTGLRTPLDAIDFGDLDAATAPRHLGVPLRDWRFEEYVIDTGHALSITIEQPAPHSLEWNELMLPAQAADEQNG